MITHNTAVVAAVALFTASFAPSRFNRLSNALVVSFLGSVSTEARSFVAESKGSGRKILAVESTGTYMVANGATWSESFQNFVAWLEADDNARTALLAQLDSDDQPTVAETSPADLPAASPVVDHGDVTAQVQEVLPEVAPNTVRSIGLTAFTAAGLTVVSRDVDGDKEPVSSGRDLDSAVQGAAAVVAVELGVSQPPMTPAQGRKAFDAFWMAECAAKGGHGTYYTRMFVDAFWAAVRMAHELQLFTGKLAPTRENAVKLGQAIRDAARARGIDAESGQKIRKTDAG